MRGPAGGKFYLLLSVKKNTTCDMFDLNIWSQFSIFNRCYYFFLAFREQNLVEIWQS